ncbi:MAG TPA: hypothetical protein PKA16_10465 [Ottowia sp.]|uniref:hypothetical protein n=1 Tax=Ottowia sp. TaxID=1898956 RepID=UPI002CC4E6E5|nr:hypothetical protein [Ottowia sp.]HMN21803.1 hypothetical protein [Ottowia sp.]
MTPQRQALGGVLRGGLGSAIVALLLAGCALFPDPERVAPGTPVAQVLEQLGRPSAHFPAGGGMDERLQYSYQPGGQRVINLDLDDRGRVVRVEQVLNEALFAQRIEPDRWTRADVLREYGPPARIEQVHNFHGDIWVWRYLTGPTWRLLFIDIDPTGVVRGWSTGDEPLSDPPEPPR